ncbi:unnamed protein product, partial [Meganyctiphanes norvegica]
HPPVDIGIGASMSVESHYQEEGEPHRNHIQQAREVRQQSSTPLREPHQQPRGNSFLPVDIGNGAFMDVDMHYRLDNEPQMDHHHQTKVERQYFTDIPQSDMQHTSRGNSH